MRNILLASMIFSLAACNGGSGNSGEATGDSGSNTTITLLKPVLSTAVNEVSLVSGSATIPLTWTYAAAATNLQWKVLVNDVAHTTLSDASLRSFSYSASTTGDYRFVIQICDGSRCESSEPVIVKVIESSANGSGNSGELAKPALTIATAEYRLQGGSVAIPLTWQYSASDTGLLWKILLDNSVVTTLSTGSTRAYSLAVNSAGLHSFAVQSCNANRCETSNVINLTLLAEVVTPTQPGMPTIAGIHSQYTMQNGKATLHASWNKTSGANGSRFEWYINNTLKHSETLTTLQTGTYTFDVTAAGQYIVKGKLCNSNACTDSNTISTSIENATPAKPVIAAIPATHNLTNGEASIAISWSASGEKGDNWKLVLNDAVIHSAALASSTQSGAYNYKTNKTGTHRFIVWLCQATLCNESDPVSTTVNTTSTSESTPNTVPDNALGFYDTDKNGATRSIRNDLTGTLSGMVQFAQSHTVDPNGNAAKNMPKLLAQREALLLFTPTQTANGIKATVSVNGVQKGVLTLRTPKQLMRADSTNGDGRAEVVYSKRAHSAVMPWDWVQPGLSIQFENDAKQTGSLAADKIEMSAPSELTLYFIRLGMLTDYPNNDDHYFLDHPAEAAADYFETLPVSQLTVGSYEPMKLSEVMIGDGTIYTTRSNDNGDVYSGDMRGDVAKSQFSIGVDFANQGVIARDMSQWYPWISNIITSHHAQGLYANGVQTHGLSGGGGIGTLYASIGNELSHELGHNYSLGHYPGQNGDDYFWAGHHADSGWGYIGHRARMRANIYWNGGLGKGINKLNYNNLYSYHSDSMSGGEIDSAFSYFTHYTGYSARIIQDFLAAHAVADTSSSTKWRKWNSNTKTMDEHTPQHVVGKLKKMHVPVYTIIGAYVPTQNKAVIYPAFRGNHGHIYEMPAKASSGDQCWLDISFNNGSSRTYGLPAAKIGSSTANQFAVNIEQAEQPTRAQLFCQRSADGNVARQLYDRSISVSTAAMPAYVTVGRAQRYEALAAVEMPKLQAALLAVSNPNKPVLDNQARIWLDSYASQLNQLSSQAYAVAQRYLQQQKDIADVDTFMTSHASKLDANDSATLTSLRNKLSGYGFAESSGWLPTRTAVKVEGYCLVLENAPSAPQSSVKTCANSNAEKWFMDGRGAIHSAQYPGLCLAGSVSSRVAVGPCNGDASGQSFVYDNNQYLRWSINTSRAVDYARNSGYPLMYGFHGGSNQIWTGLFRSDNPLYISLSATNLNRLANLQ